jgi:hypothetical protein
LPRILSIILLLLALLPVPVKAATSPSTRETKRVLILYSQEKGHPAHDLTDQGIRAGFAAKPGIEAYYSVALTPWALLTPNVQVVKGAQKNIRVCCC